MEEEIQRAKEVLREARSVTILTGAGISAESGIPTFRSGEGLWKKYRPQDIATPEAFQRDPEFVWGWYNERRETISRAEPNPGHYALVQLERTKPKFTLITQNIDDLHKVARSINVVELHGNIWQARCTRCNVVEENRDVPLKEIPPLCKNCGALLRPNVVWFGENIPITIIDTCLMAIEHSEVMLIVGTSGVVEPAASMGLVARSTGKTVIEVNAERTVNSSLYDIVLLGNSGEILPRIIAD